MLKVKLAISIISISSIHLLRTFIEVGDIGARTDESVTGETYTSEGVFWQVVIHLACIVSGARARVDRQAIREAPLDRAVGDPVDHALTRHAKGR